MGARQARGATGSDSPRERRAISAPALQTVLGCYSTLRWGSASRVCAAARTRRTLSTVCCGGGGARACAGEYALAVI